MSQWVPEIRLQFPSGRRQNTAEKHLPCALNTKQHSKRMQSWTCLLFMPMTVEGESSSVRGMLQEQVNCGSMKFADEPEYHNQGANASPNAMGE
jgi:hypothetical protein